MVPGPVGRTSRNKTTVVPRQQPSWISNARNIIMAYQERVGSTVLCILVFLYIASFCAFAIGRQERLAFIDSRMLSSSPNSQQTEARPPGGDSSAQQTISQLPGSINSDSKTFEGSQEKDQARDPNSLPGGINVAGPFDNGPMVVGEEPTTAGGGPTVAATTSAAHPMTFQTSSQYISSVSEAFAGSTTVMVSNSVQQTRQDNVGARRPRRKRRRRRLKRKSEAPVSESGGTSEATERKGSKNTPSGESGVSGDKPQQRTTDHPMNRNSVHLQVEGNTGVLDRMGVKERYSKLVKSYLEPFQNGIRRASFFKILRRKNYSMAPPESNKGIQTILFQIIKKRIYLMDPYEVSKSPKAFYRTRISELVWLLRSVMEERDLPDTEFLVAIHDCVQTVSEPHTYRGAHYAESSPTFTIVACNFSDNIPFPMWEGDEQRGGGLAGWDAKMSSYKDSDTTPWQRKVNKAVFRGGNRPSMYFLNKKDANENCDVVGRSRLMHLSKENSDLFDVSISGRCGGESFVMSRLQEARHHRYKYILYAEGNCFWADRLNKQVFGPSAILKQETPCGQYWEPLLRPMTHYLPTDFFFNDAVDRIKWGNGHSSEVEAIVKNANEFATNFLSLEGIKTYVEVLLTEYTALLEEKNIEQEKGSTDVTDNDPGGP